MDLHAALAAWPGSHAAAVVALGADGAEVLATAGDLGTVYAHASVTKAAASLAVLDQVARGTCRLDDVVLDNGGTLEHLLCHAAGLPLDGDRPIAAPGTRRIYSNSGIERAVTHAARAAGRTPVELVDEGVFDRLGMSRTRIEGSVASGARGPTEDLCRLVAELLAPTLLPAWLAARQRAVAYPGLDGVLPGFGRQRPCDWGLGVEVKGPKQPHWTGARWPASTYGHFGQAGGFLAVDPDAGVAVVTLGDAPFGPWAAAAWPSFTDAARDAR